MEDVDLRFMREAIEWAKLCKPTKPSIPLVGAILATGDNVLGRGHRGSGILGDDDHAEWVALQKVQDRSKLSGATIDRRRRRMQETRW